MKFSRLRLLGFKSFVEPGEFVIERGLTGIVGPNGCGKSNLVEALRWVMGESSYKNMRASGMDDVIFSGSSTRPARNTAEVTLFLDNQDRTAPAAFNDADELQVSRRIEREAGSVYRINGKEARARDVQLLFADQSTGARSPSMVGQGRIGELIQAKPQARRALLEEAAGISGLHSRRHEAELRLRAAEQNLERLDDLTGQLEGQIEALRRQARQAARFKNLSADIRRAEATVLHLRWTQAKLHEQETRSALDAATALVAQRAAEQITAAKDQAVAALRLPELREAEAAAAAALQRLTIARGQIEEEARRVAVRQAELERRLGELEADIAREQKLLGDNASTLERLAAEEAALRRDEEGAEARQAESLAGLEAASSRLAESERVLGVLTAERAAAAAQRQQAERAVREAAERRDRFARQLGDIERETAGLAAKLAVLPDPAQLRVEADAATARRARAEQDVLAAEGAVEEARRAEAAARAPLGELRGAVAAAEAEKRTLQRILDAGTGGSYTPVLDAVSVERGWETALGAALGDDIAAPLDAAAPSHWGGAEPRADDPELPAGVRSLAEFVDAPEALRRRLAQIGVVGPGEGAALRPSLATGQQLVTREGALWRWDGFVARADAPSAAAQRLAQKNRMAELAVELAAAAGKLRDVEATVADAEAGLRTATQTLATARQGLREAQLAETQARDGLLKAEKASGELASRHAAVKEARDRVAQNRDEAAAALGAAEGELHAAPDLSDLQARLDSASAAVARDRAAQAEARARHDGLRREAELRGRRLEAIRTEGQSWQRRAAEAEAQIAALAERRGELTAEQEAIADAPGELDARRRMLMTQLSEAETLRKAAADRLQAAENRQTELDRSASASLQALSQAREARGRAEERSAAAEERRREAEARIQATLGVAAHLAARQAELDPVAPLPDLGEVEGRLERLKTERERLGAVNLRAEEEQKELSERLETIVSEREDIVEAIGKLRQAIHSLNREGRERLLAAFGEVDGHFRQLFTHLFSGGTAELQLIESEDPLEAGLEIIARPPGKKPQTMTLLSGGEQALTAMALIFAVFLTNPAPICVLDEVDAPLDDHNVERFCNLMDRMAESTETRFVIITHNPITMARMDRLFGVTMAEQGVSQLVSVDLQSAERMREAS